MRLSGYEIDAIKKAFRETFGDGMIYLFGSRVDDAKRGGDIDLYIIPQYKERAEDDRTDFLIRLYDLIGEQKIDIVIAKDNKRPIEQQALRYGVNLMDNKIRLQKYLNECQKHKIRIEKSYSKVKDIFPLSAAKYENLSDDEIEAIDQYLFRFSKLQDTLGDKVFKLIAGEYVEDVSKLTFIDILNKLEQVELIEAKVWKKLRSIRNEISHQYDDEPEEMAESLNRIFACKNDLLKIFDNIYDYCGEKFNFSNLQ